MNHLPVPRNDHLSPLEIPYVCGELPDFDGLEFEAYPLRRGWSTPEDKFHWIEAPVSTTAKRAQNWLYFGLLHVFFGRRFDKQDFVTLSLSTNSWVVDTRILPQYCSDLATLVQNDRVLGNVKSPARKEMRERWTSAILEAKLHYEVLAGNKSVEFHHILMLVIAPIPILLQSLRRLVDRIFWFDSDDSMRSNVLLAPATFSTFRMLDLHWCKAQVGNLLRSYSPYVNHYLSALPRQHLNSHDAGCTWDKCVANSVDEETYQTKHVWDTCSCQSIGPDPHQLSTLLERNKIPLIQLHLTNGQPELELVAAELDTEYVSVSHVWAGGSVISKRTHCRSASFLDFMNVLTTCVDSVHQGLIL